MKQTYNTNFVEAATIAALLHDIGKSNQAFQSRLIDYLLSQGMTAEIGRASIDNLPPLAQFVAWLIVTHHRLPPSTNTPSGKVDRRKAKLKSMFDFYTAHCAKKLSIAKSICSFF